MLKILLGLFFTLSAQASIFPNLGVDAYVQAPLTRAYSASTLFKAPYATPSDVCMLENLSTSGVTMKVLHARVLTFQTTAGLNAWYIVKRSDVDQTSSMTALTVVPHNSNLAASGADVQMITASPTVGLLTGIVRSADVFSGPATATNSGQVFDFDFGPNSGAAPLYLNPNGEMIALNFNGAAVPSGMDFICEFNWTEE